MSEYTDNWEGKIENSKIFNIKVEILNIKSEKAFVRISNTKNNIDFPVPINLNNNSIKIAFSENFSFEGVLSKDNKEINGFIKSGLLLYHLKLTQSNHNSYVGNWNILMIDELKSQDLYLSIENGLQNEYQAYPILGDNRFTGTWCDNFQKDNNVISFLDFKTGLHFKGKLENKKIQLNIFLDNFLISEIDLKRSQSDWKIGDFKIENTNSVLKLTEMEDLIFKDSLPNTHSVLISRKGKLFYENYFNGYTATIPHDMRSASKSISSAIIGIALDKSLFKNVNQSIFDFLSPKYQTQKDSLKAKINIQSLLTMSSGLDAIDYGKNANSKSPATEENFQRTTDWTRSVLSASMINAPNTQANYGSANPYLLGIAMDSIINEPLELFMDRNLFQKLHISNYIIQTDLKGKPYFGGGMYLTPRDMLSFGELYLNYGKWNSKRIISRKWVNDSFKNHHALENTIDKNGYGYLWWHNTYFSKGKKIKTIEARGAGGQYIFIIPSLKVVVVITSGNFRNGKTQQPEKIFEDYILPNIKK
ncbi:serine hydrolase [Flavobacterium sp. 9AF]|uniref:serine hydrolase domain-containing protein n=1 Tax=Flavobacterium sp. 9AF TaxID=2653142 RepID=UPI001359855C|nr:serine hydrolase [Flavobacterium sp. 9AF]